MPPVTLALTQAGVDDDLEREVLLTENCKVLLLIITVILTKFNFIFICKYFYVLINYCRDKNCWVCTN